MDPWQRSGASRRVLLGRVAGWTLLAAWSWPLRAQTGNEFPVRTVRIVVPFPAGGATDMMARNVSQKLNESWKQPVLVDNRAGANGMIGADAVAKAPADGYTLLVATIAHAANVSLFPKAPYQFEAELRPAAVLGLIPLVAVVRTQSPLKSLPELAEAARGGSLNAGSSGNGTAAHLALELFNRAVRGRAKHVPYKGGAPAMTDLLAGQIDVIFALLPEALPHLRSGRLRALAVTSDQRHPLVPDIPTTAEAGVPELVVTSWNVLMAPAAVPGDFLARVNAEVRRAMEEPELRARVVEQGFQPVGWSVGEAESFVAAEVQRWGKVIRDANIKPD